MRLQNFQSKILFLSVGTNVLPAAVAGRLLCPPDGYVVPVHTDRTKDATDRLVRYLTKHGIRYKQPLCLTTATEGTTIYDEMANYLKALEEEAFFDVENLGLHYTGGTKTMSVHLHRSMTHWCNYNGEYQLPKLTYLDASTFDVILDSALNEGGRSFRWNTKTQEGAFNISLEEMLDLHDWAHQKRHVTKFTPTLSAAMAQMFGSDENKKAFHAWRTSEVLAQSLLSGATGTLPAVANNTNQARSLNGELAKIPAQAEVLRKQYDKEFPGKNQFRKYFTGGTWLELYVFDVLKGMEQRIGLHDICWGLEARKSGPPSFNREDPFFEVDVVAIHRHQLFAISCGLRGDGIPTQADQKGSQQEGGRTPKEELKLKLFEVYLRARQIGGDEARCALVCNWASPRALEAEVGSVIGRPGQIKVFGAPDLPFLSDKLGNWIREQTKGA